MTNVTPRWDGDTRGRGVGNARAFVHGASELVEAMHAGDWVTEDPDAHLLPWLTAACAESPFELVGTQTQDDGTFVVTLRWCGESNGAGQIRSAVFALVGSFAETATYVRQRRSEDGLAFELVTGIVDDDTPFASHGHSLRLAVDL